MAFYSYIFTANYSGFLNNLKQVAKEEGKFLPLLLADTVWCVFRYGFALSDYLNYKIYRRTSAQRREYVGVRTQNSFYETVSPSQYKKRYTDKSSSCHGSKNFWKSNKHQTRTFAESFGSTAGKSEYSGNNH